MTNILIFVLFLTAIVVTILFFISLVVFFYSIRKKKIANTVRNNARMLFSPAAIFYFEDLNDEQKVFARRVKVRGLILSVIILLLVILTKINTS